MYGFNYQAQPYRSKGIISPPTAKPGQKLLLGGDWTLDACQGQGTKHGLFCVFVPSPYVPGGGELALLLLAGEEVLPSKLNLELFKTTDILACLLGFNGMFFSLLS
ncbi:hypothetical protein AMECASPLE_028045 [Ameca splendens]|uniref:Uncharacterized protein n=1 Tax=Ameca splendens TaxID=208324 RepID=A0ABV0ZQ80_9TELE